nr:MAG TPA: hypothetical protein [Caudoviricetes sp.]
MPTFAPVKIIHLIGVSGGLGYWLEKIKGFFSTPFSVIYIRRLPFPYYM